MKDREWQERRHLRVYDGERFTGMWKTAEMKCGVGTCSRWVSGLRGNGNGAADQAGGD